MEQKSQPTTNSVTSFLKKHKKPIQFICVALLGLMGGNVDRIWESLPKLVVLPEKVEKLEIRIETIEEKVATLEEGLNKEKDTNNKLSEFQNTFQQEQLLIPKN